MALMMMKLKTLLLLSAIVISDMVRLPPVMAFQSIRVTPILVDSSIHTNTRIGQSVLSIQQQYQSSEKSTCPRRTAVVQFMAAGMGMGSSSSGSTKTKTKKNSKNNKGMGGGVDVGRKGMQQSKTEQQQQQQQQPFNVQSSVQRLEKKYDEILKEHTKTLLSDDDDDDDDDTRRTNDSNDDIQTSEYVIAARAIGHIDDWVPIAQLVIARQASTNDDPNSSTSTTSSYMYNNNNNDDHTNDNLCRIMLSSSSLSRYDQKLILASISLNRRELYYSATTGSKFFNSVPRNLVQYSVESIDSFRKFVYDPIIEPTSSSSKSSDTKIGIDTVQNTMSKQEARNVLLLTDDMVEWDIIKKQYRTLSFQYHPDRFVTPAATTGRETTTSTNTLVQTNTVEEATEQFHRIRLAYETLQSGRKVTSSETSTSSSSWYASLGGKSRTDFIGPLQLMSMSDAITFFQPTTTTATSGQSSTTPQQPPQCAICSFNPSIVQTFVTRAIENYS